MFKTILVPTDGSRLSELAIAGAVTFASQTGASLVAIAVAEAYPYPMGSEGGIVPDMSGYETSLRESANKHVQRVAELAAAKNVPCKTTVVTAFSPAEEIVNAAREYACDLIWMASHGRNGIERMLMGSQTQKVLAYAVAPVLVYPLKK